MAVNEQDVEKIVRQILNEMGGSSAQAPPYAGTGSTAGGGLGLLSGLVGRTTGSATGRNRHITIPGSEILKRHTDFLLFRFGIAPLVRS